MTIKLRFLLTLGFLLAGFAAVLIVLHVLESHAAAAAVAARRADQRAQLEHWLQTDRSTLTREARVLAAARGDPQPAPGAVQPFEAVATLDVAGRLAGPGAAGMSGLPLADPSFRAAMLQPEGAHFFLLRGDRVHEAWVEPVAGTADRWLLALRAWDEPVIGLLAGLSGARLIVMPAGAGDAAHDRIPLADWRGRPVAWLAAEFPADADARAGGTSFAPAPWFIAFGLLVMLSLALGLRWWVLRPLDQISASLAEGTPAPLRTLPAERTELGRVARLVETSFAQRDELRRSESSLQQALQERIRLGRDLHDSVIQSLYAAGMGLAGLKSRLHPDQADVARGLEQSRAALNETILDLRNFITGLEPEALREQTFAEAVANLLAFVASMRTLHTDCRIDEALAARLSLTQRANILQIAREAISNALRHGGADAIAVSLYAEGADVVFEIGDNGCGFNPAAAGGQGGHGLDNLAGRARDIGARLTLESRPGQGARLRLTFVPDSSPLS